MRNLLVGLFALLLLLPVVHIFAQTTNTQSTLGVKLTSTEPFSYKDEEGYTVVIGEVENTKSFPVTNVKIQAGFYDDAAAGPGGKSPLETATGTTLLTIIPPYGKSPFMIVSESPDPDITHINLNILGFNSAGTAQKQQLLEIKPSSASIGNTVKMSAEITNKGQQESTGTSVHLIALDAFNPPRIVDIETMQVDDIGVGDSQDVEFDVDVDYRASSFKLIAESDKYQSKLTDVTKVTLETMTKLITINNVQLEDQSGVRISQVKIGTPVNITSDLTIQYGAKTNEKQEYVYYAQVKQFGEKAPVEFLGFSEGAFASPDLQTASVEWTPQSEGGFFVEAYVWDRDGMALAAPSKTISIILVKP
ncbi:hypothetical protein [Candidatus Nitrosotenuis cloacae]|uniref:hypothetical protein n=1 Tax=Candidatus Nitrosotenuis cloacae TaxID=1603555 RepID=UPI00227E6C42|nr:hypothetical protein [Candidatus Nitrosotenuis cloacae]